MANLVSVEKADLSLGTTVLLDQVSFGVSTGSTIGVVGRNGGGKTTLLRVLAGSLPVDAGRVTRVSGLVVGMLSQADELDPDALVREVVVPGFSEHEWAGRPRIREILRGLLGYDPSRTLERTDASESGPDARATPDPAHRPEEALHLDAPVGQLSGGERRRIALAALLIADPDLLLLDEPTNHLDIEGVAWLAAHLRTRRPDQALVVVTHDRWFLDAVATDTWEVVDGRVESYEGGYAAYVLAKAERERIAAVTAARRNNLLRKELAWLRRGAPARTSKPKFRLDAASALIADEPEPRDEVALMRFATTRLGKDVVDLLDATLHLGSRTLLDRMTWRLAPGQRVGIVGVNGAGKSSLLRLVHGEVPLTAGKRKVGKTVVMAYLSQEVRELDDLADHRVIDAITQVRARIRLGDKEMSASQLAQRLGFTGARQQSRVADLSGGERRRLQLLRLLMTEPNVLLLDEPTNDLDIETLTSLEDVLDGWVGTLLVVSHDRYLLERICDSQVALLGDGLLRDLPGGVEQYLRLRADRLASGQATPGSAPSGAAPTPAASGVSGGSGVSNGAAAAAGKSSVTPAQQHAARKEMARVERALTKLSSAEDRVHAAMVEQATDHEAMARLDAQLRELAAEREALEHAWLEAAELCE